MKDRPWLKTALSPFSRVYGWVTDLRNQLYDRGSFSSRKASQIVVSIGNITVGGTGKTPVTEYLANLLSARNPIAILSRGYGRKTKGFLLADDNSTAETIGDEPLQFYNKFKNKPVTVVVSEDRAVGAARLAEIRPEARIILLDDAFQHRAIRRDINILLSDFNRPFYKDLPFPAGRLRENRNGAKRADAVIVTKCPHEPDALIRKQITEQINKYTSENVPVFFSKTDYAEPLTYAGSPVKLKNVKIAAGIADPRPFIRYVDTHFHVLDQMLFPDHYNYKATDVEELIKYLKNGTFVLTTEKDMVKLKPLVAQSGHIDRFAYIPVTVHFGSDTDRFNAWFGLRIEALQNTAAR
ncbi:Tetraacyldisaccharide 4'-kinase [Dyadobacter sp. CECT 9623]|uniref:Tetraacyldisaccharide 4'-kinase n=1 Tax=Dyadobacter linearis TaxID=2823330 RepID=A0ABM8UW49_9BACT|nr:tetraacyldisaccharide 4'-kinase [Dyadobacter sp. CECT 9623]CAG5073062.1 Tetraacyldisaccharide 4'-kinase [Dyadobacter sp. CECT 9623]